MRLTILGGGGFRVPLVYRALAADDTAPRVTELVLHDVDPARLKTIATVLDQMAPPGSPPRVVLTTDLVEAVAGADFVFSAIRVGGLEGRICDERAALDQGVLGQETTGAGGVCYGLRTVPVALHIARTVAEHAPYAYVINFTNPAGMITEAMAGVLGERVVGICDSPVGMFKRVARALDIDPSAAFFDYAGLNHLGWLRRVVVNGVDLLPGLLADDAALRGIEEGRLFGPSWVRTLGAVPNEYLWYWQYTAEAINASRSGGRTRGEHLAREQAAFYAAAADPPGDGSERSAFHAWERTRREREESYMADSRSATNAGQRDEEDLVGGGYDRVALSLMHAIARNEPTRLVLNVRNGHTLAGLDAEAVVEVSCVVDANGPHPLATAPLAPFAHGVVTTVKDVERTTIEAARTGSVGLATRALALHPLVDSVTTARRILETQRAQQPDLAYLSGS